MDISVNFANLKAKGVAKNNFETVLDIGGPFALNLVLFSHSVGFSNTSSLTIFILGSGESRDSAKEPRHVADTDIRLGWKFNFFPSISRLFFVGGVQSL